MSEDDIFWLAARASYCYRDVYGRFPLRIGVHPYWRNLRFRDIRFPLPQPQDTFRAVMAGMINPAGQGDVHITPIMVYLFPEVQPHHVWLYHPDATDWIPSDLVFDLAGVPLDARTPPPAVGAD